MFIALIGIGITGFLIFFRVEHQFGEYVDTNRNKTIEELRTFLVEHYQQTGNLDSNQVRSWLHQDSMTNDLFIQVLDQNGEVLVDSNHMQQMMNRHRQELDLDQEVRVQLTSENEEMGTLVVNYSTDLIGADDEFIRNLQQQVIWAVLLTTVLSILISVFISSRLTVKLKEIVQMVKQIRGPNKQSRLSVPNFELELQPLAEAFNDLLDTLEKEDHLRKRYTADLAHELRTPLATLRSQIEAYQDGVWQPSDDHLAKTHAELMRLVRLVDDLEQLIVAENPQIQLRMEKLSANDILKRLIHQFQASFYNKGLGLHGHTDPYNPTFSGDLDRSLQILTNIVINAYDYTPAKKRVDICVFHNDQYVGFKVKDQGVGIEKSQLPHLFERFYRGDLSRERTSGGLGIGLAIAKALIEAHKGKIIVQSEVGKGTCVVVCFPINQ